jgi:predicted nuclease of restriction endonuclease-like (RecB) superfamily
MSNQIVKNYSKILDSLKSRIINARMRASISLNTELLAVYWEIGNTILQQQESEGWGAKVIDRLAIDLKSEFPDMKGLSLRNIKYMRAFAEAYPDFSIVQVPLAQLKKTKKSNSIAKTPSQFVQALLAQLTWYHHITLLDKVKEPETRMFYVQKAIQNGWSRNIMVNQIESKLHKRQGNTINNFETTLPVPQSDLAKETLKNPYVFDFLSMGEEMLERDLEKGLTQHIKKFMLELGRGFAYVGNQYNLNVDNDDYFLDLLFYNYHLHCFVVFELKVGEFKPEYTGKLNFYINTVDAQIKGKNDAPTIGVLLCKTPKETVVKYALQGIKTPIGVADYKLAEALPKQLKGEMPTIAELEAELDKEYKILQKPVDEKLNKLKELVKGLKQGVAKEKNSPENILKVLNKVILPLKKSIVIELEKKEIISYFREVEITFWNDRQGYKTDKELKESLKKNEYTGEFRIEIRLKGFKQAGTKAFNTSQELYCTLSEYKYSIGLARNEQKYIVEKLYDQSPDKIEIEQIIDEFAEKLLDDITRQVEHISK